MTQPSPEHITELQRGLASITPAHLETVMDEVVPIVVESFEDPEEIGVEDLSAEAAEALVDEEAPPYPVLLDHLPERLMERLMDAGADDDEAVQAAYHMTAGVSLIIGAAETQADELEVTAAPLQSLNSLTPDQVLQAADHVFDQLGTTEFQPALNDAGARYPAIPVVVNAIRFRMERDAGGQADDSHIEDLATTAMITAWIIARALDTSRPPAPAPPDDPDPQRGVILATE